MNKEVFISIINKAFIKSNDDTAKVLIESKEGSSRLRCLIQRAISSTLTDIYISDFGLEDSKLLIIDPKRLLNMLSVNDEEIEVELFHKNNIFQKIIIKDNNFTNEYSLGDPSIIQDLPVVDEPDKYDVKLELDKHFIDKFLKARKANSAEATKETTLQIQPEKNILHFIIGEGSNYSNKIKFNVPLKSSVKFNKLYFSADTMADILTVNKNTNNFEFNLFSEGLMKLKFIENNIESNYFLIASENI